MYALGARTFGLIHAVNDRRRRRLASDVDQGLTDQVLNDELPSIPLAEKVAVINVLLSKASTTG